LAGAADSATRSHAYDANGNTLTDPSTKSYSWDFENRLTQVVNPGVGTTTFRYDPFGRRIQKSGPLGTTNFLYDSANLLEEVDNSGNVLARYTEGTEIDQPFSELRSGTTSYYEADGLSTITSLSSAAGTLPQTYTFDSFGNQTASSGSLTNPFRYTGREFDSETNLYYYRTRYYDPTIGRFTSEDRIRFGSGDPNFYDYVSNNPTAWRDPTGRTRIYGNWCGPDWTGGLPEQYDPAHAGIYKPPKDRYDTVCMHHDICYFNCRSTQPCSPSGRSDCFKVCDQIFVGEMPGAGFWPDVLAAGIYWHGNFGPDPGPNSSNCPKCHVSPFNKKYSCNFLGVCTRNNNF
jgi:RHS repeat-associated protein